MAKPKPIGASQIFAEAGQSHKVHLLSSRIEELEAEVIHLKNQNLHPQEKLELEKKVLELTQQLAFQGGVQDVSISSIKRNIFQPRQTFPKAELESFAELLRAEGQNTPIILFPWGNDYLIFDGERRWRAAQLIHWQTLKAVFIPVESKIIDIKEIQSQALSTSIHRKDLHPLDLAECLINQIIYRYPKLEEEENRIPTILNTLLQRLKRRGKIPELTAIATASRYKQREWLEIAGLKEIELPILQTLLDYQLNPSSINANVFPMLAISLDLKEAVREFGLDASKIRIINQLTSAHLKMDEEKAADVRRETVRKVVEGNLSLNETRKLVNQLLKADDSKEPVSHSSSKKAIRSLQVISVEDWSTEEIDAFKQALLDKLTELNQAK